MKMLLVLLASLTVSEAWAGPTARTDVPRQAILLLELGAKVEKLERALPEGCRIVDQMPRMAVVRCSKTIDTPALKGFEKLPGVQAVKADALVAPQEETKADKPCCEKAGVPDPIGSGAKGAAAVKDALKCPLDEKCPNTMPFYVEEIHKHWAQRRVDADLMQAELARLGVKPGHTKVAVIDSGFDLDGGGKHFARPVQVFKGSPESGDPKLDEIGHGTVVSSAIGGAVGLGVAPDVDLSVYRATTPGTEAEASAAMLIASLNRACDDGNEVLNVSYGGEGGLFAPGKSEGDRKLLRSFAERGCLIFNSAGNGGTDRREGRVDPDDALIIVEASDADSQLAGFSSRGEVTAPGKQVFLVSSKGGFSVESACGTDFGRLSEGTSDASPISAGITAEVIGVLKTGTRYATLPNPDRIKVLNRILRASQTHRSVNGLRAVLIAERWNASTTPVLPVGTEQDFQNLLTGSPPSFCAEERKPCLPLDDCAKVKECFQGLRKRMSACPVLDRDTVQDALLTAVQAEDFPTAAHWIGFLTATRKDPSELVGEAVVPVMKHYNDLWAKQALVILDDDFPPKDLNVAIDLFPSFLAVSKDPVPELNALLSASEVVGDLDPGGRDRRAALDGVRAIYRRFRESWGKEALLKLVQGTLSPEKFRENGSAGSRLMVLNDLVEDKAFEDIRVELLDLDAKAYLELEQQTFSAELSTSVLGELRPFFRRHKDQMTEAVQVALNGGGFAKLGVAQVSYVLFAPEEFDGASDARFPLAILEAAASDRGWGIGGTEEISKRAMFRMHAALSAVKSEPERKKLRQKLLGILKSAMDLSVINGAMKFLSSSVMSDRDKDLLLDSAGQVDLARQIAQFPVQKAEGFFESVLLLGSDSFVNLIPKLVDAPSSFKPRAPKEDIPEYRGFSMGDRFKPATEEGVFRTVKTRTNGEVLDDFAAWLLRNYYETAKQPESAERSIVLVRGIDILKPLLRDGKLKRKLSKKGKAWAALEMLRKDVKENAGSYMNGNYQDLAKLLE